MVSLKMILFLNALCSVAPFAAMTLLLNVLLVPIWLNFCKICSVPSKKMMKWFNKFWTLSLNSCFLDLQEKLFYTKRRWFQLCSNCWVTKILIFAFWLMLFLIMSNSMTILGDRRSKLNAFTITISFSCSFWMIMKSSTLYMLLEANNIPMTCTTRCTTIRAHRCTVMLMDSILRVSTRLTNTMSKTTSMETKATSKVFTLKVSVTGFGRTKNNDEAITQTYV